MVAGHFVILALLGLIFVISPWVAFGAVPMALGIFLLELFVALVQAYIFTMLSALFIGAGLTGHAEHGEQAHPEPGAAPEHQIQDSHVAGSVPGHG
jgi:F-type H+-transporting ATPase subunit a